MSRADEAVALLQGLLRIDVRDLALAVECYRHVALRLLG